MRTIILALLISASILSLKAQTLKGLVKAAEDGEPIAYATVALLKPDSSVVTGTTTEDYGSFELQYIAPGDYLALFSFIGYEKLYQKVNIPTQSNLGEIRIHESTTRVQEVVVSAKRPFVVQRADRYIVDISSHIQTSGRNALEVLSTTPGVIVNPDGNISVMGKAVNIYIDGRPSYLSGEQLRQLLSSMQGERIDRVEVITNPSARYDASGGSIIDIRMKRALDEGVNGSAELNYRQGRVDKETAGLSLNFRKKKLNIFGNYNPERASSWKRVNQETGVELGGERHDFKQEATSQAIDPTFGQQYKVGVDYFLTPQHTIGGFFTGYHANDAEHRILSNTSITPSLDEVVRTTSDSRASDWNDGKQVNLNYQGSFKPQQQLNIDLDYGRFQSTPYQHSLNEYFDTSGTLLGDNSEQLRHSNPQNIDLWAAKVDYSQPLGEQARIEFGGKLSHSKTDNNLLYDIFSGGSWEADLNQTNHFVYTENIDALYITLSRAFGKWNLQPRLRGEYTSSKGEQQTTAEVNDSSYFDLFPSVYVDYRMSDKHQFNIGYSRRIMRPAYAQLNPFEVTIDAYSFTAGNPYLRPLIMDNISLSYTNQYGLMMRFALNLMNDMMLEVPVQRGNRYGLVYDNFGKRTTLTLMLNYRKMLTKFWMINLAFQGGYEHNVTDESDRNGLAGDIQLYNAFTLSPTWSAELTALYSSPQNYAYYHSQALSNVSVGIRKMLLKNRLSVSLTANDLFRTYKTDMQGRKDGMDYRVKMEGVTSWVGIGLRYTFGSNQIRSSRWRSSSIEDETSRVK